MTHETDCGVYFTFFTPLSREKNQNVIKNRLVELFITKDEVRAAIQ